MKRVTEKVRDIVEVRPFANLHDFSADPRLTLAGYHFTDITSDLMGKWLDRVAGVRPRNGAAHALAGFRGVGKSHFLSVVAAIASRPELRAGLTDSHAASAAERLSRRPAPVVSVRRGAGTSLLDEIKRAVAEVIGVNTATLNDSLHDLLLRGSEHAGDVPMLIMIDTALDRSVRVARDDGALLSELADAAKTLGIFVGVALDDDISGADGANSSIAASFTIDYLDQEHLYKIVDTHIFSKHGKMLPLLHDIYENYRSVMPGFRWSEQRFSSLYPLHPATLELAPLIRLYLHDFALLGFASDAGEKILGRPANSLIGLDEIFDGVEARLRTVQDLRDAFATFDKVDQDVVAKTPVQFRLQAKLILKGLLMMSLDGRGSTAAEVAAAMMIFTERGAGNSPTDLADVLDSFATAAPGGIKRTADEGAESRYRFQLNSNGEVDSVLEEAAKAVPDAVVFQTLGRLTSDKFFDVDPGSETTQCTLEWRGGLRRGEICWRALTLPVLEHRPEPALDWSLTVHMSESSATREEPMNASLTWNLGDLTEAEKDTIKRSHLLHNDEALRTQLADGVATAAHVHSIAVEKIWRRVFLADSSITCGRDTYEFPEDADAVHSLTQLLSQTLAPIFESQYPMHPEFVQTLGAAQSASLIDSFFSGSDGKNAEIQKLAEDFALPLGLAVWQNDDGYMPAASEALWELDMVRCGFGLMQLDGRASIPIAEITAGLGAGPYGLTREARQLFMAALVAQRQLEFVTTSGDRINHRSLDLQILWDDLVALARPAEEVYSAERLISWARLLTGNPDLRNLENNEDRRAISDSLSDWLTGWRAVRTLDRFDALPDENLNAAIWRTAASLRKPFGGMAAAIDRLANDDLSLDQCLHNIAENFSDSEVEFDRKHADLRAIALYIQTASKRSDIKTYLSTCEITDNTQIETLRQEILDVLCTGRVELSDGFESNWNDFKLLFADHYREKHDIFVQSMASGHALGDIVQSDEWAAFESVSVHPWFDPGYSDRARSAMREMRQVKCLAKLNETLSSKPYCGCRFNLADSDRLIDLPSRLQTTIAQGLESFRLRLLDNGEHLVDVIDRISAGDKAGAASIIRSLAEFTTGGTLPAFTRQEIRLLCAAADQVTDITFEETAPEAAEDKLLNGGSDWHPTTISKQVVF